MHEWQKKNRVSDLDIVREILTKKQNANNEHTILRSFFQEGYETAITVQSADYWLSLERNSQKEILLPSKR